MAVWVAMEQLVTLGKARYIGLCNVDLFTLARIYNAASIKPSIVQNRYKKANEFDEHVRGFCAEYGIVYETFGVLGAANLELLDLPVVKTLAKEKDWTVQEAFLKLVLASKVEEGLQGCILTGTSKLERMSRDLDVVCNGQSVEKQVVEDFREALGNVVIQL